MSFVSPLRKFSTILEPLIQQINRFTGKGFTQNVALIVGGTVLGQASSVIAAPILTRYYSPQEFGVFAAYLSVAAILVPVASLRYDYAVPLPKNDEDAANLVVASTLSSVFISLLIMLTFVWFGQRIGNVLGIQLFGAMRWIVPIGVLAMAVTNLLAIWANRKSYYQEIAQSNMQQGLLTTAFQLLGGASGLGAIGLIFGQMAGQCGAFLSLMRKSIRNDRAIFSKVSFKGIRNIVRVYVKFPLISAPSQAVNALGGNLPIFLLTSAFGSGVVGWYLLANRFVGLPLGVVGTSYGQVFWAEMAKLMNGNPSGIENRFLSATRQLALIALPFFIAAAAAPLIFPLLFGESWRAAGMYCLYLAPMTLSGFIINSTSNLNTYGLNHWQTGWEAGRLIAVAFFFAVARHFQWSSDQTILGLSLIGTLAYICLFILNLSATRRIARTGRTYW